MEKKQQYASEAEVQEAFDKIQQVETALNTVVFGQEDLIKLVITGLLSKGNLLLEGMPGLGKTELVKGLSKVISLATKRVQFTPDLLPGDITGTPVLQENENGREFVFQKGPVFTHILLADEINRASPKTQAALLEAMQEQRVTVLGETHSLPSPFFVLATQNPIDLEGTYPLPEAQLDRFLFKLNIERNDVATMQRIIQNRELGVEPSVEAVMSPEALEEVLSTVRRVYLPEPVANYMARLVEATHSSESARFLKHGASPRAALALAVAAKALAVVNNRNHASFEDVRFLAPAVLRHRIQLDYAAKVEQKSADDVIDEILKEVSFDGLETPKALK